MNRIGQLNVSVMKMILLAVLFAAFAIFLIVTVLQPQLLDALKKVGFDISLIPLFPCAWRWAQPINASASQSTIR